MMSTSYRFQPLVCCITMYSNLVSVSVYLLALACMATWLSISSHC